MCCLEDDKKDFIHDLYLTFNTVQTMIFCNTKKAAQSLQEHLIKQGIKAEKLTSDMQK